MHAKTIIGLLTVAIAGALAGRALAPRLAPQRMVAVGPVRLIVASDWTARPPAVAFGPPADGTLVPRALGARPTGVPQQVRLGGYRAWTYAESGVTVLPTSRGVLALACGACARGVQAVDVEAAILTPVPDLAFALRLRPVLAGLSTAQVRLRAQLADARTRSARSDAATALAREHATAVRELQPYAGPRGRTLVDRLTDSAAAYRHFAAAGSTPTTRRAVEAADARLTATIAQFRLVSARQPAGPPPTPTTRHSAAAAMWLLLALAGAVLTRSRARPRHEVVAVTAPPAPQPRSVSPPPGPVPAASRWDAAPRASGAGPLSSLHDP